ncbi:MAG: PDZ domain-containing protein [Planctomycetia bacterium]|nr:PDZ domain-containing protein [Planctomycetia bacterium]
MKAQSIRRLLTFVNLLLALGVAGAAGWWFAKARPAMAGDPKRVAWVVPANEAYQTDANNARKADFWQVYEKDFDHIVRPDLMDVKKHPLAPGVWPFVGPVPPKVEKRAAVEPTKKEAPKGLAALGRIVAAIVPPAGSDPRDGSAAITFEFAASKRKRTFFAGALTPVEDLDPKAKAPEERLRPADAVDPRREGKYLLSVEYVGEAGGDDDPRLKVVYDEVGADPKAPAERKEEVLAIAMTTGSKTPIVVDAEGAAGAGKPATGAGRAGAPGTGTPRTGPVPLAEVKVTPVEREGRTYIELDEEAWVALSSRDLEKEILNDVKSEDVKDGDGGVRVTGVAPGSVPAKFGIQQGDVLISVAGQRVRNRNEALEVAKGLPKDTTGVAVVIRRDGVERTVVVDPRDPKTRAAAGKVGFDKGK